MGGACGASRLLGIYLISKMHTKTIQKIQKAYIKTYEKDVKIYKDIENSQGTLLLQKCRPLYTSTSLLLLVLFPCWFIPYTYIYITSIIKMLINYDENTNHLNYYKSAGGDS